MLIASAAVVIAGTAIPPSMVVDGVNVRIGDVPELKRKKRINSKSKSTVKCISVVRSKPFYPSPAIDIP